MNKEGFTSPQNREASIVTGAAESATTWENFQ